MRVFYPFFHSLQLRLNKNVFAWSFGRLVIRCFGPIFLEDVTGYGGGGWRGGGGSFIPRTVLGLSVLYISYKLIAF